MADGDKKQSCKSKVSVGDKEQSCKRKVSVGYHLFLYREQLRNPKAKAIKLSKAKYQFTTDLVVITWDNITSYSKEERDHLVDSIIYKKKLQQKIKKKKSKNPKEATARK